MHQLGTILLALVLAGCGAASANAGTDELSLSLYADAVSRTLRSHAYTVAAGKEAVRPRRTWSRSRWTIRKRPKATSRLRSRAPAFP